MSILKELWTDQAPEGEIKMAYQYVIDLRNRLEETCKLATENIKKAQAKYTNILQP